MCTICQWRWKQPPSEACPGVRRYGYGEVPEHLVSATELRRRKLRAVEDPVGVYKRAKSPYDWLYFYDVRAAQPRRVPTEAQREAIVKMRAALVKTYTCERCGWYDDSHNLHRGRYRHRHIGTLKVNGEDKRYCSECRDYLIWVYDRQVIEQNMALLFAEDDEHSGVTPFVVLDTETIGLPDHPAFQIVEVCVVDHTGTIVFHSLVKPDIPMPEEATRIHGLTDADLTTAPSFAEIWPHLVDALSQRNIWCYHAAFDRAAIIASAERFHLDIPPEVRKFEHWHCMMLAFARYYGEYSSYHKSDKYQTLATACVELDVPGNDYHRARGDALNTLRVMRALAARGGDFPAPEERPVYHSNDVFYEYS